MTTLNYHIGLVALYSLRIFWKLITDTCSV